MCSEAMTPRTLKKWSLAGTRKLPASLLVAASLLSVGAFAGCGSNDPSIPPDAGSPAPDAGGAPPDAAPGDPGTAAAVRSYIESQVPGGLAKLQVPDSDRAIPVPPAPQAYPGRFDTTEAKRFLGKMLFHDPIRTSRVNTNQGQPLDFPKATAFGGTIGITDSPDGPPPAGTFANTTSANVQQVMAATLQTGSCGSCHIGEAAGKAGQQLNFNTGGEGRGFTDASGTFVPRRRPMASLTKLRTEPLFPGDALVDALPTLADIFMLKGERIVTTPALFYHNIGEPTLGLLQTGRLDQLDSVGRLSPSLVGFAFNNRLLFGGFAGEPHTTIGSLQPSSILLKPAFDDPPAENITFLLLDAHRMLDLGAKSLQGNAAFVQAFREAFPDEAAAFDRSGNKDDLVNNFTQARAVATFLRTVVTRNTPYDKFLAGDNSALTATQLRGAKLFFTPAANGGGGAGCVSCHSGPMLNKQANDPDLAGVGQFVDENFINVGIGDHPVQALTALAKGHATAYHAEDTGREEVTKNPDHLYKFRSLTMRQLKDARQFFHSGALTRVRDVVAYFNAGVPADPTAGAARTLDPRFTSPRGAGTTGLGLSEAQIDDLTDFLENGLHDPTFAASFQPTADDLAYSTKHPTLAAKGAKDGQLLSGAAIDDNDPLARRDQGLEFLNVTPQVTLAPSSTGNTDTWLITNRSASVIDTHLLVILTNLAAGVTVDTTSNTTGQALPGGTSSGEPAGEPYYRIYLPNGVLNPGQSTSLTVTRTGGGASTSYTLKLLSGQGKP
jgi:cytochrome c peroxidase